MAPSSAIAGAERQLLSCPRCGAQVPVSPSQLGAVLRCTQCGKTLRLVSRGGQAGGSRIARRAADPHASASQLAGQRLGGYLLERVIGEGRMGVVYCGYDETLQRRVAVKVLHWHFKDSGGQDPHQWILHEARAAASLTHPHIVQIYQLGRAGDFSFIAMEYVEGASAEQLVIRDGPFTPMMATKVLWQAADAVRTAHAAGIVHRDLKPGNLLVTTEGKVKVADFGLAARVSERPEKKARVRVGTPHYFAPELWRFEPATPATDVYALGATYFAMLTGRHLYPAEDRERLCWQHQNAPLPDPRHHERDVPPECVALLHRCIAKSPAERFATAEELCWAARDLLHRLERPAIRATPDFHVNGSGVGVGPPECSGISMAFRKASGLWADVFGFDRQPFSTVAPPECPYQGEPFASLGRALRRYIEEPGEIVVVSGEEGSGKTTFVLNQLAPVLEHRSILRKELYSSESLTGIISRLRRSAGAPPPTGSTPHREIEALLDWVTEVCLATGALPIVLIDAVRELEESSAKELGLLLRAAASTRKLNVLLLAQGVIGAGNFLDQLNRYGVELPGSLLFRELKLPPLSLAQSVRYVRDWIDAAIHPQAPPLCIPLLPLLLACHHAGGNPRRINRAVANMLFLAGADSRRKVTLWDAQAGAEHPFVLQAREDVTADLRRPPERWPSIAVNRAVKDCLFQYLRQ